MCSWLSVCHQLKRGSAEENRLPLYSFVSSWRPKSHWNEKENCTGNRIFSLPPKQSGQSGSRPTERELIEDFPMTEISVSEDDDGVGYC